MKTENELKEDVRSRYAAIALQGKAENAASCCGATTPSNKVYNIMMDDYSTTEGYVESADLGLSCGLPTQFAKIKEGDTVTSAFPMILGWFCADSFLPCANTTHPAQQIISTDEMRIPTPGLLDPNGRPPFPVLPLIQIDPPCRSSSRHDILSSSRTTPISLPLSPSESLPRLFSHR